ELAFDPYPRLIDEVHVVDARRACRHAGKAGEAAVDMSDHRRSRRPVLLQHLLDQVDAPARAIELVAQQYIGRTGCRAKAAMHTGPQDLVGLRDVGIGKLGQAELRLHVAGPRIMRPRLRIALGSKLARTRSLKPASPAGRGWNTSI